MLFNSIDFIAFFVSVYSLYLILHKNWQNYLLLAASYLFYSYWDWRFLGLLWLSTAVDYFCGVHIGKRVSSKTKTCLLGLSVVVNLGILAIFKYYGFFIKNLNLILHQFGLGLSPTIADFVLPIGISFYTFQSLSYTIDVYRGTVKPSRNILDVALYVAFFPQLISGPIERAKDMLPQIEQPRLITARHLKIGLFLILLGYYKKVVVADNLAVYLESYVNYPLSQFGAKVLVMFPLGLAVLYTDFSGYSDIAQGLAALMGFKLSYNFLQPGRTTNPRDFISRWHMTLTLWFKDYVYVPLITWLSLPSANLNKFVAMMVTWALVGLWHGPKWHFVAWGLSCALLILCYRPFIGKAPFVPTIVSRVVCYSFISVLTILFSVKDISHVPNFIHRIVNPFAWNALEPFLTLVIFSTPLWWINRIQDKTGKYEFLVDASSTKQIVGYTTLWLFILLCGSSGDYEFLYFQF